MNQARLKNFIEVASNVAVVVTALIVVGSFARSYFRPIPRVALQGGLQRGAQLLQFPGLDFSRSTNTAGRYGRELRLLSRECSILYYAC
jgi:hypothetical protein